MALSLFDSYKKQLVEIQPKNNRIKIYSCGPTVYQYQHIGNMRAAWLPDTFVKAAKIAGCEVDWVLNITDVGHLVGDGDDGVNIFEGEDKLEKAAKKENRNVTEIVEFYTEDYLNQSKALKLNIPSGKNRPKATEYILGQMKLALELVRDGRAYVLDDGIYFESQANLDLNVPFELEKIGDKKFTDRNIIGSQKNPGDFAIWKFVSENTLQKWKFNQFDETAIVMLEVLDKLDNPNIFDLPNRWGTPGWHSECVVMISEILGDGFPPKTNQENNVIDVHFGGEDHIDIHHRNEILQSEALGFHLSKTWVHNKFVLVDGKKMSKSIGNVYLVQGKKSETGFDSITEKGYSPLAYKMMLMEHHYSTQLDFTWAKLDQSQTRLYNLRKEFAKILSFAESKNIEITGLINEEEKKSLLESLVNNLDTPKLLEKFNELVKSTISGNEINKQNLEQMVFWEREFLELNLIPEIPADITNLGADRLTAKLEKDFQKSDELRDEITKKGYQIDDYPWGYGIWKKL